LRAGFGPLVRQLIEPAGAWVARSVGRSVGSKLRARLQRLPRPGQLEELVGSAVSRELSKLSALSGPPCRRGRTAACRTPPTCRCRGCTNGTAVAAATRKRPNDITSR
jgi:hypothetical protein